MTDTGNGRPRRPEFVDDPADDEAADGSGGAADWYPDDDELDEAERGGRGPNMTLVAAGAVALVVVAVVAFLLLSQRANDAKDDQAASSTTLPEMVELTDEGAGISFKHPASWTRLEDRSGQRRVVLLESDNNGMWVSLYGVPSEVGDLRTFARGIITQGSEPVAIGLENEITLNNLPGFYFFYTFHDSLTGQQAAHFRYFLRRGSQVISLVFQVSPATDHARLTPIFDKIAESFQAAPVSGTTQAPASSTTIRR